MPGFLLPEPWGPPADSEALVTHAASRGHAVGAAESSPSPLCLGFFPQLSFVWLRLAKFCFQGEPLPQGNGKSVVVSMSLDRPDGSPLSRRLGRTCLAGGGQWPGQLGCQGGVAGCHSQPSSSGIKGQLGFLCGCQGGVFAETGLVLGTDTGHTPCNIWARNGSRRKPGTGWGWGAPASEPTLM